jgi:uncharacterized membrane protein
MLEWLYRGTPGHPIHPPLTDATIGAYTFATVAAILSKLGVWEEQAASAWAIALVVALAFSALTSLTGFADWIRITRGTPLFRTATAHMIANLLATAAFLVAIGAGYGEAMDGEITTAARVITLVGFGLLTLGGWLGGTIVFHYGMRVLERDEDPAAQASSPVPHPEEEAAES